MKERCIHPGARFRCYDCPKRAVRPVANVGAMPPRLGLTQRRLFLKLRRLHRDGWDSVGLDQLRLRGVSRRGRRRALDRLVARGIATVDGVSTNELDLAWALADEWRDGGWRDPIF